MEDINGYLFPSRVWEKSPAGWSSRTVTECDEERRESTVKELENARARIAAYRAAEEPK